ncbi:hypothetical protein LBMAG26_16140 [Bacteroidota bacterium]|nr:hypothetical protein LBMAG26_16140 [Bacteroidota bacterium]
MEAMGSHHIANIEYRWVKSITIVKSNGKGPLVASLNAIDYLE